MHLDTLREIITAHKEIKEPVDTYQVAVAYAGASTQDSSDETAALARQAHTELDGK